MKFDWLTVLAILLAAVGLAANVIIVRRERRWWRWAQRFVDRAFGITRQEPRE